MGARNYARLVAGNRYRLLQRSSGLTMHGLAQRAKNSLGRRSQIHARSKAVFVAGLKIRRNSNGACREAARGPLPIFFTNPFLNFLQPFGEYNSPPKSLLQWDGRNLRSRK